MSDLKQVIRQGDDLFSKRGDLLNLWQSIADNFYVERSDFTVNRTLGEDFASHLTSSYPIIVRRELGDAISGMLRPRGQQWMAISIDREDRLDNAGRKWLEQSTKIMLRAMYDRATQFVRATKEGDHDFASFGQCVITKQIQWDKQALLYRCWHLRDVVWCENSAGMIDEVHRNWNPTLRTLEQTFGKKGLHPTMLKGIAKDPYKTVKCRHLVMPAEYGSKTYRTPYVSMWLDLENNHIMREEGSNDLIYCIPRWVTVSGSQYAYSPATVAGLPDARLIQAMTLTLLEAGEMAVRPPLIATKDAIRDDIALYAGGITWADAEYDERLGEVLRPVFQDKSGLPFGVEVEQDRRQMLATAFYLNKLSLPPSDREMTAFETGQRIQEYIRNALPLFEPMETDYNGNLCEMTFNDLMRVGAFGPAKDIPQSLRGESVQFKFESPLHQAIERQKGTKFMEAKGLLLEAAQLDPGSVATVNARVALRDALNGIGIEAKWLRDEEEVEQKAAELEQAQQAQAMMAQLQQGAEAGEQVGKAGKALAEVA